MKPKSPSASTEAAGRRGRETDPTLGVRILATDFYFYEVRCVWALVPPNWVGAWTRRVPDRIRDRLGVELY